MGLGKKTKFDLAVIDLVREKRIEHNLTQDMIAAFIGTNRSYVAHVESPASHQKYNLNHLNLIAEAMDCSPREFIPLHPIPEEEETVKAPKKKTATKKKKL